MNEFFGGNVFDVGTTSPTRGMSVGAFLKAMGGDPLQSGDSFEPLEPEMKDLGGTTSSREAYLSSLQRLNQFGMDASARGINVMNPGRNPESRKAAQVFQRLMQDVNSQASGLMVDKQVRDIYHKEALKAGRTAPKIGNRNTTYQDLDNIANTGDYQKMMFDKIKELNDHVAREYPDAVSRDAANIALNEKREEFNRFKQSMIAEGIPEAEVELMINNAKDSLGAAWNDPLGEAKIRSQIAKNNRSGRKDDDKKELISRRKELIAKIQNGDPEALNFLKGYKDVNGDPITDVEFITTEGGDSVLQVGGQTIEISKDNGYGFGEIFNLINANKSTQGERLTIEELGEVPDANLDVIEREAKLKRVEKGNTITSEQLNSALTKGALDKELPAEDKEIFIKFGKIDGEDIVEMKTKNSAWFGLGKTQNVAVTSSGKEVNVSNMNDEQIREIFKNADVIKGTEISNNEVEEVEPVDQNNNVAPPPNLRKNN